jgi:hypothetical protein
VQEEKGEQTGSKHLLEEKTFTEDGIQAAKRMGR